MLVDQRYIFSSIWHRYCLFTPLVTFFLTRHHKVDTVHNIHIGAGSGPKRSPRAPHTGVYKSYWKSHIVIFRSRTSREAVKLSSACTRAARTFPSDSSHRQKSHCDTDFSSFFFVLQQNSRFRLHIYIMCQ